MDIRKKCIILSRWAVTATALFLFMILYHHLRPVIGDFWYAVALICIILVQGFGGILLERSLRLPPKDSCTPAASDR